MFKTFNNSLMVFNISQPDIQVTILGGNSKVPIKNLIMNLITSLKVNVQN